MFAKDGTPVAFNFCVRGAEDYVCLYVEKNGGKCNITANNNFIEYKEPSVKEEAMKEAIKLFGKDKKEILEIIKKNFTPKKKYKRYSGIILD